MAFQPLASRAVIANFDGGDLTSDTGGLARREVDARIGLLRRFAACFQDHRRPELVEHSVAELVAQRVYGLALGYEDLNDHDQLRRDPLLAVLAGKTDPKGTTRRREQDCGKALAGKSTLNRLELTPEKPQVKYKRIVAQPEAIDRLLVDIFLEAHGRAPERIVVDLDATDDPLYGNQEGRFFHGYYGDYCYLPLYIFAGEHLLCARLRRSNIDACEGALEELQRIVAQIRARWPQVAIVIRGDSGFCREEIMGWCELQRVDYVLGLAKNERLVRILEPKLRQAAWRFRQTGQAARCFKEFFYQTQKSWRRKRPVVGKAEWLDKGANPRFVVTSFKRTPWEARALYEQLYCARGDMENRIKEQQLDLFADRTSTGKMRSNQLRLYFSGMAYVLVQAFRRLGLAGTEMAKAQCQTIRLKLLKIGAQIKVTVRKIWIALASGHPYAAIFRQACAHLRRLPARC
ncbi:MAG: IS1380 family transposase [Bryobacteraceae bacterium]|nr:IS1380 family transposase [Bryobacteraceae bacterium]